MIIKNYKFKSVISISSECLTFNKHRRDKGIK